VGKPPKAGESSGQLRRRLQMEIILLTSPEAEWGKYLETIVLSLDFPPQNCPRMENPTPLFP
jgi:hypothetical protein